MPSSTSIPIIVQGNTFSLAIPLQIYVISGSSMVLQDYTPDPTDVVTIQLKGDRRQYTYTPSIQGNTAFIDLDGTELADNYGVIVTIVKQDSTRLRSFRTDQFFIVESSDDLTTDDIIEGLENNVIYLNSQCFVAGEAGRGITNIAKTSTSGLVDTYTITYSDSTTSTFQVTNGRNGTNGTNGTNGRDGADGADGDDGVGIASIVETTHTTTSGGRNVVTVTLTDGTTATFDVYNGAKGDSGQVPLKNVTGSSAALQANTFVRFTNSLSAITVTLETPTDPDVANIYAFSFYAATANPTITLPQGVQVADTPEIGQSDYVEFSIMDNKAIAKVWSAS